MNIDLLLSAIGFIAESTLYPIKDRITIIEQILNLANQEEAK